MVEARIFRHWWKLFDEIKDNFQTYEKSVPSYQMLPVLYHGRQVGFAVVHPDPKLSTEGHTYVVPSRV